MIRHLSTGIRAALGTLLVCAVVYPALVLGAGRVLARHESRGSLIRSNDGAIIGSQLLAQGFDNPGYLWPRPSAVHFDASASGGSNLAPTNPALRERAALGVSKLQMDDRIVPGELVAASGSGLDPHITLVGALFQAPRIARARGLRVQRVVDIFRRRASSGTPWSPRLVNVLAANLALDRELGVVSLRSGP